MIKLPVKFYFKRSMCLTLFSSAGLTKVNLVKARLRFALLGQNVTFKGVLSFDFPEAVSLKRFLALEFVFCLASYFKLYNYFLLCCRLKSK